VHKQRVNGFGVVKVATVSIALLLAIGGIFAALTLPGIREWQDMEQKARSLVARKAPMQEAVDVFGSRFFDYSIGSGNESRRADFLTDESPGSFREVRTKFSKYPGALFFSTPDVMMWLFLNESNRVVDFSLSAQ